MAASSSVCWVTTSSRSGRSRGRRGLAGSSRISLLYLVSVAEVGSSSLEVRSILISGVPSVEVKALACDMVLVSTIGFWNSWCLRERILPVDKGDAPG